MYTTPRIALAMFIIAFLGVVRGLWGLKLLIPTTKLGSGRGTVGKCTGPKWSKRPFWSKGPYSELDFSIPRPKWSILVHFGLKRSILVHLGPPTVLWPFLKNEVAACDLFDFESSFVSLQVTCSVQNGHSPRRWRQQSHLLANNEACSFGRKDDKANDVNKGGARTSHTRAGSLGTILPLDPQSLPNCFREQFR